MPLGRTKGLHHRTQARALVEFEGISLFLPAEEFQGLRPLIFFLACLALMLGCGSDSTVLLARLALCALSDNGGIATYYLVDLCDLILGITLVYLI